MKLERGDSPELKRRFVLYGVQVIETPFERLNVPAVQGPDGSRYHTWYR